MRSLQKAPEPAALPEQAGRRAGIWCSTPVASSTAKHGCSMQQNDTQVAGASRAHQVGVDLQGSLVALQGRRHHALLDESAGQVVVGISEGRLQA